MKTRILTMLLAIFLCLPLPLVVSAEETAEVEDVLEVSEEILAQFMPQTAAKAMTLPVGFGDRIVAEKEPNDPVTALNAEKMFGERLDYAPVIISGGDTAKGVLGTHPLFEFDWADYYEFTVEHPGWVDIFVVSQFSALDLLYDTSLSVSDLSVTLYRRNEGVSADEEIAAEKNPNPISYESYRYGYTLHAPVQPGTYRISMNDSMIASTESVGTNGKNYYMFYLSVTACDHEGAQPVVIEPTCTEQGYTSYVCGKCNTETTKGHYVLELGHLEVTIPGVAATCIENGLSDGIKCSRCEEVLKEREKTPLGEHKFTGEWELSKAPDYYNEGLYLRDCEVCTQARITIPVLARGETHFEIPEGVTRIRQSAFHTHHYLESVTIPAGVTSIGDFAFYDCSNLEQVTIPEGVISIGKRAFEGCGHLTNVTIPASVTSIGLQAFFNCEQLEQVHISDLEAWLRIDFPKSESYLGPGILRVGSILYLNGEPLTECVIPEGITQIPDYSLAYQGMKRVVIPESVTEIGWGSFRGCSGLTEVQIPASVTTIGGYAFADCENLTEIEIPESVTTIEDRAFSGCKSLQKIVLPAGMTTVSEGLLENCVALKEVVLPEKLTVIERRSFENCESLNEIELPDGLIRIDNNAFTCTKLQKIDLPPKLEVLGDCAFRKTSLQSVVVPGSVTEIGEDVFTGSKLREITYLPGVTKISPSSYYQFDVKRITIPHGVTEIPGYYFVLNYDTSIVIPDSITRISANAISSYYGIGIGIEGKITIPESVTHMEENAVTFGGPLFGEVYFLGDAPKFDGRVFKDVIAYYPAGNKTWTREILNADTGVSKWIACYHKFEGTSCTSLGKCVNCGATEYYSHNFSEASCTAPQTCTLCGIISGKTTEHEQVIHSEKRPTCTTPGRTQERTCKHCDTVLLASIEIPAPGHKFEEKYCTVCGDENPDYVEPTEPPEPTVERIAGTNRISTAIASANKLKEVLGVAKFDTILVANAMDFPDALSGSYLAAAAKAPILLYANGQKSVTDYIRNNLAPGGIVYILGGEKSVSNELITILDGIECERVAGSGRFATSLAIIRKADELRGAKPDKVLICHALAFADSLSASATGLPILLVNGGGSLNADQKAYLESVRGAELYVIGGKASVSEDILTALNAYDANGAERVYGSGRELTSVEVAKKFFPEAKTAALASSLDFPDGLSGGPVAYAMNMPLLLTRENKESIAESYVNTNGILEGYVIGGTDAVSDAIANAVFGIE